MPSRTWRHSEGTLLDALGSCDIITVVEAPDDAAVTALGLSLGALGNVCTQTLRAFSKAEMAAIKGKMV